VAIVSYLAVESYLALEPYLALESYLAVVSYLVIESYLAIVFYMAVVSYLAVKSYLARSPGTVMKEYNEFSEWFLRTFSGAYEAVHFHTYLSCYLADPLFHADFYRPFIQLSLNLYEFIWLLCAQLGYWT